MRRLHFHFAVILLSPALSHGLGFFYCRTLGLSPVLHRRVRDLSRSDFAGVWAVSKCSDLTEAVDRYCQLKWAAGLEILPRNGRPVSEAVPFADETSCRLGLARQLQTLNERTDIDTYRCFESATLESLVMTNESTGSNFDAWREWRIPMQKPSFKRCLPPPGADPHPIGP